MNNTIITANEAAQKLNVSSQTVKRWIKEGKLKGHKSEDRWYVQTDDPTFGQHMVSNNGSAVEYLRDEISHLRELLARSNQQMESMSQQNDRLTQLLALSQQQKQLLIETSGKSWWQKMWDRRGNKDKRQEENVGIS